MMQRIVIEVHMKNRKRRAKAMEIAAVADGVDSVAFKEENQNQMVIVGTGVDAAGLTLTLRKKIGHGTLEDVQQLIMEDT